MHKDCIQCDINQMIKLSQILNLDAKKEQQLIDITQEYIETCDMKKTNPEIMGEIWKRITPILGTDNPYKDIKSDYNQLVSSMQIDCRSLYLSLKVATLGNLIDFAAKHTFTQDSFKKLIKDAQNMSFSIDDSQELFERLSKAQTLLYLGDNCGEIVLDKYFIQEIKNNYPQLDVVYGVRGQSIVNDITIDDALEVHMEETAQVLSNGDGSLGTVLDRTSQEFQNLFQKADIVICKGQGNYEGLCHVNKPNLFFLFMAKCDIVAKMIGVERMSIVCMKNKT